MVAFDADQLRAGLHSSVTEERLDAIVEIGKRGLREMRPLIDAFIADTDPMIREAAIRVLGFYWKLPEYEECALRMSREDPDPETRMVALMAWADYHNNTRDAEVLRYLYTVMRDAAQPKMVRAIACSSFFAVCGVPSQDRPRKIMQPDKSVDETIDWSRVERLLAENTK